LGENDNGERQSVGINGGNTDGRLYPVLVLKKIRRQVKEKSIVSCSSNGIYVSDSRKEKKGGEAKGSVFK